MSKDTVEQAVEALVEEHSFDREADLRKLVNVLRTRNAMAPCTCGHALKHHKRSGRCRKSCMCDYAKRKDERKRRRGEHV